MGKQTCPSLAALSVVACVAAGCGGETDASAGGAGGVPAGGAPSSGGATSDGGALSSGGGSSGAVAMGGTVPSGGATTGGSVSSGGVLPTGGAAVSGGTATGGLPGSGGMSTGGATTGGSVSSGGALPTGGAAVSGGTATGGLPGSGGMSTGGAATGGTTSVPECEPVTTLPAKGTMCSTAGQSLCHADGSRCVCERGMWYCNTGCDTTRPTPGSACDLGTVCAYPSDVACTCNPAGWYCMHLSGCPADYPATGDGCNGSEDTYCDYPQAIPPYDLECFCTEGSDGSAWTCVLLSCPAEQPSYDLNVLCHGVGICRYGSTLCECLNDSPWICGLLLGPYILAPPDG